MTHRSEASREDGFQDEIPESSWSPERRRFEEQAGMLVKALRSTEEGVRELAIVQISLQGPKAVPHLISALEDALNERDLRHASHESVSSAERSIAGICRALGIIGASDAIVDLAAALPRKEALEALAKIGGERALDLVMGTIENEPGHGGPLSHIGNSSWPSGSAGADPAFVRRVFLLFGEAGRWRLEEELVNGSSSSRAAVAEIIRIMGYSDSSP